MSKLRSHGKRSILLVLTAAAASVALLVVGSGAIFSSAASRSAEPWRLLPPAPIRIDAGLTSVWTGEEMLVSGVTASPDETPLGAVDVAAAYNPATNTWRRLGAPPKTESYCRRSAVWTGPLRERATPAAVWTGRELIVWGGVIGTPAGTSIAPEHPVDGAAFDPRSESCCGSAQ